MRFSAAMTFPMFNMAGDDKPRPMAAKPSAPFAAQSAMPISVPQAQRSPADDGLAPDERVRLYGEW